MKKNNLKYRKKTKPKIEEQVIKKTEQNKNSISIFDKYIASYNIFIVIGLIIFIGIIAFGKYFTGEYLFFFKDIGSDSLNQDYPAIIHKLNLMKSGLFSKWSFYAGMGEAQNNIISIDPYTGLRFMEKRVGASIYGSNYFIFGNFIRKFIFNFLMAGVFFYYYLRTISVNKFSALVGALTISFSAFIVVGSSWGFAGHVFKAVFLLFAFEQLYIKKRWYFLPFAFIYLSSNIFNLYIYSLFLIIYIIFRLSYSNEGSVIEFFKLISKIAILGISGLMMNALNSFPVFKKMFFSPRVSGNASYSQILSAGDNIAEQANLGATTILRFFSSDILGTGSNFQGWQNYFEAPLFYIGLLTLLLFPQVFIHLNKRKKIIFGSFLGFWTLTLFFPYLRHAFLAFTGDYFRYGFDFFIPFTLLFFSIYALNKLDENFKINLPLLVGTLLLLIVVLIFPYKSIPSKAIDFNLRKIIIVFLMLYSGLIYFMANKKYKSLAQIGLIILLVAELSYFSYKSYASRVPVTKAEFEQDAGGYNDGTIQAVDYLKTIDEVAFYRTEKNYQSGNSIHGSLNDAQAQGYYGTANYSSFNQLNYIRFLEEMELIQKGDETATRWVIGLRSLPLLQTFANVKYYFSKDKKSFMESSGFDSIATINNIKILKNKYYLPFGYTYDKCVDFEGFKTLIKYKITSQSLKTINEEFARLNLAQVGIKITQSLKPIENKTFNSKKEFENSIKSLIGNQNFESYKLLIIKHSVDNFKNKIALLNAFVYEEDSNIDVSQLKKVSATDTSVFIGLEKFTFQKYEQLVDSLKSDTLQINRFENSRIEGKIELSESKMLFLTIPYDAGWKIKVNGQKEKLYRVNIGFTGIVLPKGKHEIEIYYVPQYSKLTSSISIISIILFWIFLGFDIYRKRRRKKQITD